MIIEEAGDVYGTKFGVAKDWLGCPLLVDGSVCRWWASDKVVCNWVLMVCC